MSCELEDEFEPAAAGGEVILHEVEEGEEEEVLVEEGEEVHMEVDGDTRTIVIQTKVGEMEFKFQQFHSQFVFQNNCVSVAQDFSFS